MGEIPPLVAQPGGDRDPEAHLRPVEDRVGDPAPAGLLQQPLAGAAPDLHVRRQGGGELHHLVVEQRRACLERVGHRGDVHLHEQVTGQVGLHVDVHGRVRRIGGSRVGEDPGEEVVGIEAPDGLLHLVGVELLLLLVREGGEDLGVPGGRGRQAEVEEALHAPHGRAVLAGRRVVFTDRAKAFDRAALSSEAEARRKVRTLAGNVQLLWLEPRLLMPFVNPVWLQFYSHKLGRLAVPYALLTLMTSSIALASQHAFYAAVLAGQCAFYLLAGFAALLFLFHPVQTESVAYIAGRSESLSGLFAARSAVRLK